MRLRGRIDRPWRLFSIGIVIVIGIVFYADWRAFQASTRQVDEARQFVRQTNSVLSSVKDAETGERGYLLTGDVKYLDPYNAAMKALPGELDSLSQTAHSAHRNINQIAHIRTLIGDKLAEMRKAIQVRNEEGAAAAIDFVRTNEGQLTMDEVRTACQVLTSGEAAAMYERTRSSELLANRSRIVVLAGCLALTVLLFRLGAVTDEVISEREQFAGTLEESRQLLQTTLASIGDAVIVSDSGGQVRFMNPVAEALTGWRVAGAGWRDLGEIWKIEPETGDPMKPTLTAKSGERIPIEYSSAPIRDSGNRELGTVLVFRDVRRRRAAERELERWKEIFAGAGFGLFVIDPATGAIVDMNPEFAAMHGYSVAELQGKSIACLRSEPNDTVSASADLREAISQAAKEGRYMFEQIDRRRDGSEFAALIDITTFSDHGREYCAGYCSDVSERKKFEDAVRESEERFRTLANALPQMIWSTDHLGRTEYVNQSWLAYTGWTPSDGASHYPADLWDRLVHSDDRESFLARWRQSLATGNVFEEQVRLRHPEDGTSRWFLCRAVAVRDRENAIVRWLGGCTDVQQQVESARQLRNANDALTRSNADLEQFAYAASHDLQEPLRMVAIYSELLKDEYRASLDERATTYLDFAVSGAQRMSALLKALLTYARVTDSPAGNSAAEWQRGNAQTAVAGALLNLSSMIQDAGAKVLASPLPEVAVREIHLTQLFQNLIGNAVKYRREQYPDGQGPEVRIEAKHCQNSQWLFSVRDNGIGIESEYLNQIFGLFKRLHGQHYEGTGIGLALCQKIVERTGGKIWAESEPGVGSTFFFTLPGVNS